MSEDRSQSSSCDTDSHSNTHLSLTEQCSSEDHNSETAAVCHQEEPYRVELNLSPDDEIQKVSSQESIFPPSISFFISADDDDDDTTDKSELVTSKPVQFDPSSFNHYFPELSFNSDNISRTVSMPTVPVGPSEENSSIKTSLSTPSVDPKSCNTVRVSVPQELTQHRVVVSDLIGSLHATPVFSDVSLMESEVQYNKLSVVDR